MARTRRHVVARTRHAPSQWYPPSGTLLVARTHAARTHAAARTQLHARGGTQRGDTHMAAHTRRHARDATHARTQRNAGDGTYARGGTHTRGMAARTHSARTRRHARTRWHGDAMARTRRHARRHASGSTQQRHTSRTRHHARGRTHAVVTLLLAAEQAHSREHTVENAQLTPREIWHFAGATASFVTTLAGVLVSSPVLQTLHYTQCKVRRINTCICSLTEREMVNHMPDKRATDSTRS